MTAAQQRTSGVLAVLLLVACGGSVPSDNVPRRGSDGGDVEGDGDLGDNDAGDSDPGDSLVTDSDAGDNDPGDSDDPFKAHVYDLDLLVPLEPMGNGTYWGRSFVIGTTLYTLDHTNNALWALDVTSDAGWIDKAAFMGAQPYGLVATAGIYAYVREQGSSDFWRYDPEQDAWTKLADLQAQTSAYTWVCYAALCYFPGFDGVYTFDPATQEVELVLEQYFDNPEVVFLLGDGVYWYSVNDDVLYRYDIGDNTVSEHPLPDAFSAHRALESVFVLGDRAYIAFTHELFTLDGATNTWLLEEDVVEGGAYISQALVIGEAVYGFYDKWLLQIVLNEP